MVQELEPRSDARGRVRPPERTPRAPVTESVDSQVLAAYLMHLTLQLMVAMVQVPILVLRTPLGQRHRRNGTRHWETLHPFRLNAKEMVRPGNKFGQGIGSFLGVSLLEPGPIPFVVLVRGPRVPHAAQEYLLGVVRVRKRRHRAAEESRRLHGSFHPSRLPDVPRVHLQARPRARPQHRV